jgi:hypothetical protein
VYARACVSLSTKLFQHFTLCTHSVQSTFKNLSCLIGEGANKNSTINEELDYLKTNCISKASILGVAVTLCLCSMTVLLLAVAYRHRWKLRYLFYATRLAYSCKRSRYRHRISK